MNSHFSRAVTLNDLFTDVSGTPDLQNTGNISASDLTFKRLDKHNEELRSSQEEHSIDTHAHEHDFDALKKNLISLGVELSDDIIDIMVPKSARQTGMKRCVLENQGWTARKNLQEKIASTADKDVGAVSFSDLENLLARFEN